MRQEGYLEISTHKMGAIISPPGESLFINVCKMKSSAGSLFNRAKC